MSSLCDAAAAYLEDIILYPRNARGKVDDGEQRDTSEREGLETTAAALVSLVRAVAISSIIPASKLLAAALSNPRG